jgi:hypothetical protein
MTDEAFAARRGRRGLLLLVAMFVAGALAGAAIDRVYIVRQNRAGWVGEVGRVAERRRAENNGASRAEVEIPSALERLDLTPDQQVRIRAIVTRLRPVTDSLWREVRPRAQAVENRLFQESLCVLTPEQLERWKTYMAAGFPPEITAERLRLVATGRCPRS